VHKKHVRLATEKIMENEERRQRLAFFYVNVV